MTRASRIVLIASLLCGAGRGGSRPWAAAAGPTITQVSALTTRAGCTRMSNGTVTCSGLNDTGQLGNGSTPTAWCRSRGEHPAGSGPLTGVAQVVTGNFYACARLTNGSVDCWGNNSYGQLGNGAKNGTLGPDRGEEHRPARARSRASPRSRPASTTPAPASTNGTVDCWGHNGYYELGDGTTIEHLFPHPVRQQRRPRGAHRRRSTSRRASTARARCSPTARPAAGASTSTATSATARTSPPRIPTGCKAPPGSGFLANVSVDLRRPATTPARC